MNEILIFEENERLKGMINELSMIIGTLRGILFEYEDGMKENKTYTLREIDKAIERLFYSVHWKVKNNES